MSAHKKGGFPKPSRIDALPLTGVLTVLQAERRPAVSVVTQMLVQATSSVSISQQSEPLAVNRQTMLLSLLTSR